jgi:hypothetical protein
VSGWFKRSGDSHDFSKVFQKEQCDWLLTHQLATKKKRLTIILNVGGNLNAVVIRAQLLQLVP